jgi:hypothetical protein
VPRHREGNLAKRCAAGMDLRAGETDRDVGNHGQVEESL